MKLKRIQEVKNLRGKRVLVRIDGNVPIKRNQVVLGGVNKLALVAKDVRALSDAGAKVILMTHLGRPDGKFVKSLRTNPIANRLGELAGKKVKKLDGIVGKDIEVQIGKMNNGQVVILENLRFDPREQGNSVVFAKELAKLADIYINDAFAVSHRKHTSVNSITKKLKPYAGMLLQKEIKALSKVVERPEPPFVVVIGGVKISTKIKVIKNLLKKADHVLIGGALANNFFAAQGYELGDSVFEEKGVKLAKQFLKNKKIVLPTDVLVSTSADKPVNIRVTTPDKIEKGEQIVDIGPETMSVFAEIIKSAKTLVWNGPMGKYEVDGFNQGSLFITEIAAYRSSGKTFGVVGGGDTLPLLEETQLYKYIDFISTGGGAMLTFLAGDEMPGLVPLVKK